MPMIDLPLRELETYQGINPKPVDFDTYWKTALKELETIDPSPELVSSEFQAPSADCFHLYYTGVGNVRIHAQLLKPRNTLGRGPGLVRFHGYTNHAGDWSEKLVYTAQGFTVAAWIAGDRGG
jgi:Acetyl esterase (deacetylase)